MNKPLIILIQYLGCCCVAGTLLAACGSSSSAIPRPVVQPVVNQWFQPQFYCGTDRTLMQQRCSVCHSLSRVSSAPKNRPHNGRQPLIK